MGKGSSEIQRDIERQRQSLSARIDRLDSRVRDDVQSVRDEANERAQSLADRAKSQADTAREKASEMTDKLPGSDSKFAEHPNLLLFGSFTAGLVAGMVTGGGGEEEPERPKRQMSEHIHGESEGGGMISGSVDKARGLVAGQLSTVLTELVDSFMNRAKSATKEAVDSTPKDEGIPAFFKSAWDNFSGRHDEEREPQAVGSRMEMHERDLPRDRPLSDLEQRSAEDMGLPH